MREHRDDGFTLLEILVVLAIMAAVLGVVITHGPQRSAGLETRAAAGALAQALRTARAQAIERDQLVSVVIDPARRAFAPDRGPALAFAPALPVTVLPPALRGPGTTWSIRFAPDGSATGGEVLLGAGRRRLRIAVDWLTGRIQVSDAPQT